MNEKKIDLVRQMLLKAESTTPEEAEALTAAAEKIMLRLGIDDSMIAAQDTTGVSSKVVSKTVFFEGPYRDGMAVSMYQIIRALNTCTALQVKYPKSIGLKIYGRESQVDRAILLISSLEIQAMVAMRAWWKANRGAYYWYTEGQKKLQRRQFIVSFGAGAGNRIKEEREVVENQVTGSALALLDETGRAKAAMYNEHDNIVKSRRLKGGSTDAAISGRAAGKNANVGTTALGNRKKISS